MRKMLFLAVAVLMMCGQADAGLILYAQQADVNGGAITQVASGSDFGSGSFTGTYGDFTLTIFGGSSSNTASLSSLLSAVVSIRNGSRDSETISLYVSQNNYSLPIGGPLLVESGLSGTVNTGNLQGSGVFQAYLDNGNNLLGLSDFTNGPQSVVFNGSTFDTGSAFGTFNRTGSLYSITSRVTGTITGGGEGNFSSHVNAMTTAIPEPPTLAMALVGLMGCAIWRRR